MEKPAPVEHPIHELLSRRWSPRAFAATAPDEQQLARLVEAARWAPSSYNEQPWRFLMARKGEDDNARLLSSLSPGNRIWAEAAPILILIAANTRKTRDGTRNAHAWYDTGQAVAAMIFQATADGLFVHQMSGFDPEQARRDLDLPEAVEPIAVMALGRYGDPERLPQGVRDREAKPRSRRPRSDLLLKGNPPNP